MNIITFDIEEWALAKDGGYGSPAKYAEYDNCLNRILELLDNSNIKGTFFCTGKMAETFPHVVKTIQAQGHEIGCHSYQHTWMNKMTESEAREDTHKAIFALEQCIGDKIRCYRAPAFSIGESNKWMFEILSENGITNDASVFPAQRDFGGFLNFKVTNPCIISHNGIQVTEFPIPVTILFSKRIAYSGGGYFRFFPLWFIKSQMKKQAYNMCYFHIEDLLPQDEGVMSKEQYESYFKEPGTAKNRYLRYIKTNIGKNGAFKKMEKLIKENSFVNLDVAANLSKNKELPVVYI